MNNLTERSFIANNILFTIFDNGSKGEIGLRMESIDNKFSTIRTSVPIGTLLSEYTFKMAINTEIFLRFKNPDNFYIKDESNAVYNYAKNLIKN